MTGEELYELYAAANAQHNVTIDLYGDLDEQDRAIWDDFASLIELEVDLDAEDN
jgi:hypothetical protein